MLKQSYNYTDLFYELKSMAFSSNNNSKNKQAAPVSMGLKLGETKYVCSS